MRYVGTAFFLAMIATSARRSQPRRIFRAGRRLIPSSPQQPPPPNKTVGEYRIGALDLLDVSIYQGPNFGEGVQVDASGQIALPLVGTVQAMGKTPANCRASSKRCWGPNICAIRRSRSRSRRRCPKKRSPCRAKLPSGRFRCSGPTTPSGVISMAKVRPSLPA